MMCRTATTIINKTELLHRLEDVCSKVVSLCNLKSLKEGVCIHSPIIKLGLQDHLYLNNNLLSLYSKCFSVEHARQFFDEMPCRDVVSWTGILSAHIKNERHEEALDIFDFMVLSGPYPNAFTFSSILRSCFALGDFSYGKRIHASSIKHGFESNQILGSSLIDLYSRFDSTEDACKLFSYMDSGDTVSWTTVIASCVQAGKCSHALRIYMEMLEAQVSSNEFTFVRLLAASSFIGLQYGKLIHAHAIVLGVKLNLVLKTALVNMYSRCQRIEDAIKVSKLTPEYDVILWTAIISGLAQNMKFQEAVAAFHKMEISGVSASNFTYLSMLSVCISILSLDLGRQIHSRVIRTGLEDDVPVGNALVDMYMKCSCIVEHGLRMFRGIKSPNVISWTSLIAGFAEHGFQQDSLNLFMEMRTVGVQPNSFTLSIVLRVCSAIKSPYQTLKLHGHIIKTKADYDVVVGNALVDAYAGSGRVDDAWRVVKDMNQRDSITYTSLATRLNQMGYHELALSVISHMFNAYVKIDGFSLTCFFSASASLGRIETGKQLHCYSLKSGLSCCLSVANGLIDLYGKYGLVHEARRAFTEITEPDVVSWNGLISGLASNGHISSALSAFDDMRLRGIQPDSITFLLVLSTCSHGGLVDMGLQYFHSMREMHDVEPQSDHYVCLVDILGRAGRLEEAMNIIETMPLEPDASIYKTLLAACRIHRNMNLGEDVARRGLELNPLDPAFHLLLGKLYDDCGRYDLGEKTRRSIKQKGWTAMGRVQADDKNVTLPKRA
ncbi:pentatricopeptide repeat-containing protein At5g52850, chloroplastic isoform X1 [Ricinus communis]|uniref:pentatricopeptide repeat-containing protein At5g52850, chloroplastic isoform X1 n=2 Tax=Ricinus communis TaxID=3988 RepID=UPI00201AFE75|nr:pentatricopeptide repeat-containing protein At5g52850, chloroplastic isoform X1 [Ricinus communis]